MQTTRYFSLRDNEPLVNEWLQSLDSAKIVCSTLKEWFDKLSSRLLMLKVSDETGIFVRADVHSVAEYRQLLELLNANREEQQHLMVEIKAETQFNARLRLNTKLKELQIREGELKERMK